MSSFWWIQFNIGFKIRVENGAAKKISYFYLVKFLYLIRDFFLFMIANQINFVSNSEFYFKNLCLFEFIQMYFVFLLTFSK